MDKWEPFRVWGTVEWCGHRIEGIQVPTEGTIADEPSRSQPQER